MTSSHNVHPGIRDFMNRRGIPADALRNGLLTITIDGQFRVRMRPAPDGRLALQAKVMTLPGVEGGRQADEAIERLLNLGAGMLREHASTLCFETSGQTLQLQQSLPPDISGDLLDAEVADFTNALDFWVRTGRSL